MAEPIPTTIRLRLVTQHASAMFFACAGCLHLSPGTLYPSSTDPLTEPQRELREEMRRDVEHLSVSIGPRNVSDSYPKIIAAERWILSRLEELDIEGVRDEVDLYGATAANVVATLPGNERPDEIVLIGAHYDTQIGSPGANDNASGVALLLATAKRLKDLPLGRTVRIVFFVNEENPFSGGIQMGSRLHAERSRARRDDIVLMLNVDSIGYFTSEPGSQNYPPFVFSLPSTGNFVVFATNRDNQKLLDRVVELFQAESRFPSIGIATNMKDIARSDHAPFWWQGYPALALSDTSEARDPNYHLPTDTAENLDYDEMARVAGGFVRTVRVLTDVETQLP
jgi:hypothetical protein